MFLFGKSSSSGKTPMAPATGNILITQQTDGCNPTTLVLRGEKNVPESLKAYTDGYKSVLEQTIGESVAIGKMTGMCFAPQDDKSRGYVCHYAQAGAEEGDLLSHWVGFYGTASTGTETKKVCDTSLPGTTSQGGAKGPSRGQDGKKIRR